jgi:MFS family permease
MRRSLGATIRARDPAPTGQTVTMAAPVTRPARLGAWGFVAWFGVVALLGDILYEGARSITGPLLASFGASAAVVGLVTGIGESAALVLRLVSGPVVDRTGRFWEWTIAGYVITAVSVPLLGLASALWIASGLVILERVGKAVRAPAKDTLLSHATAVTGRGRGFAVHEALDQFGALLGPLLVAGMLWLTDDDYGTSLLVLAVPGVALIALVLWLRRQVPDPAAYEDHPTPHTAPAAVQHADRLPGSFWAYAAFTALTMAGFATFGVLSFHLVTTGLLVAAVVPLVYAGAQLVDAVAALLSGWGYDALGPAVLFSLPVVAAGIPLLAFSGTVWVAVAGCLLWGVALGIQESTMRATVADLVGPGRRATAYGVFGAVVGVAAALGGVLAGSLYEVSITALVLVTAALQVLAVVVLAVTLRRARA